MRNINCLALTAADNQTTNGTQIDANQLISASFQAAFTDAQAAGTFKLQASNDIAPARNMTAIDGFTVTRWIDIPAQTTNVTAGTSAVLTIANSCYRWLRAVYTTTATGTQTITPVADVAGSLNSKYFLLQDEASVNKYYVWLNVNSAGVDPMITGRTGVPIAVATGASAATIGAALTTAIAALNSTNSFTTSGTTTVTVTNKTAGPFTPVTDGAAPTGFTFAVTAGGNGTVNINLNALSM